MVWSRLDDFFILQAHETKLERKAVFEKLKEFINGMIKEHENTYDENNIRDFVDLYVQIKRNDQEDDKDVFTSKLTIIVNSVSLVFMFENYA